MCNVRYHVFIYYHCLFIQGFYFLFYFYFFGLCCFLFWWVWPGFGVVSVNFQGPGARPSWRAVSRVELSAWRVGFGLSGLSDPSAEGVCSVMIHGWDSMWRGHGTPA